MVVNFEVNFDRNPYGTYFAGQMLTGTVTFRSDKTKKVKAVALKIRGFADVEWTETHTITISTGKSSTVSTITIVYHSHEDYIASTSYLLGSNDSQSQVTIEPGIHTYSFACRIPENCPTSFEGIHGRIRYLVKVVLVRPWKFDQSYSKGFTVLKVVDLNLSSPLLKSPSEQDVQKTFCCGPCRSKPLQMHINLPQTGFVPGQIIPVSLLVSNDSRVPVQDVKVELVMHVQFLSHTPTRKANYQRTVATKVKGDSVTDHFRKLFQYSLLVPPTPPTCIHECAIIQITYAVEAHAKVKGMHKDLVLCMPVIIGNVPLMGVISQQPRSNYNVGLVQHRQIENVSLVDGGSEEAVASTSVQAAQNKGEDNTKMEKGTEANGSASGCEVISELPVISAVEDVNSPPPWPANANFAPPSYEEAVHVPRAKLNDGDEHDYGQCDFAPRYPVFNIPNPTAPTVEELENGFTNGTGGSNKTTWL